MNKFALGTVQFGMDYGINNKKGEIPQSEVFEILNQAIKFGVDTIDTAYSYGESERVLGNFIKFSKCNLKIISKLPSCESNRVKEIFKSSLNKLGVSSLYGYLVHNFEDYKNNPGIWDELEKLKYNGKVEKIGFSFYFPSEFESVLEDDLKIDMVQVPFSVFDQRFRPYFSELKRKKVEIYARSVFLQGLAFKEPAELDSYFEPIKNKIEQSILLSKETKIPIFALCLNFVIRCEFIDKVIVGVDNIQHFNEIMQSPAYISKLDNIIHQLSNLRVDDEKIILPFNWRFAKTKVQ